MGTMGLALPWRTRISSTLRERGTRVEPSEHLADGPNPAAREALSEDAALAAGCRSGDLHAGLPLRSEEHTSELQSHLNLVCRLLLEKKKKILTPAGVSLINHHTLATTH